MSQEALHSVIENTDLLLHNTLLATEAHLQGKFVEKGIKEAVVDEAVSGVIDNQCHHSNGVPTASEQHQYFKQQFAMLVGLCAYVLLPICIKV